MKISDLEYDLPQELIAQEPLSDRAGSRMMLVSRATGEIQDLRFRDLPKILQPDHFVVLNDSAVFPARLLGHRAGGGAVELLLLRPGSSSESAAPKPPLNAASAAEHPNHALWEALARPKRKLKKDLELIFSDDLRGWVVDTSGDRVKVMFSFRGDFASVLDKTAHVPLPPYIRRADTLHDKDRYQTVYAGKRGSVAAPTAGLHFTAEVLDELRQRGVNCFFITLHVGYGTFRPLKAARIEHHHMDGETFYITAEAALGIRESLESKGKLIAVGTTTARALEHWQRSSPELRAMAGQTELFIYPPFDFRLLGGLLTNFHLPRSSLLALVCAFLGTKFTHQCYRYAVDRRYRFYSYGDCMLIL